MNVMHHIQYERKAFHPEIARCKRNDPRTMTTIIKQKKLDIGLPVTFTPIAVFRGKTAPSQASTQHEYTSKMTKVFSSSHEYKRATP